MHGIGIVDEMQPCRPIIQCVSGRAFAGWHPWMASDSFYQTAVQSYNSVCELKVICWTVPMDGIR